MTLGQLRAAIGRAVIAGDASEADRLRAEYYVRVIEDKIHECAVKSPTPFSASQVEHLHQVLLSAAGGR
jgi:hypothetical protein